MAELVLRFLIGGIVVSAFSLVGDLFKPKSFGGLFGAAPSVALATLALTIHNQGSSYAALEARSMIAGASSTFLLRTNGVLAFVAPKISSVTVHAAFDAPVVRLLLGFVVVLPEV